MNRLQSSLDPVASNVDVFDLAREKYLHIIKAAKAATMANILAPLLCIPMFRDEVDPIRFWSWLIYMMIVVAIRTVIIYRMPATKDQIMDPVADLKKISLAISIVGLGWGLGWPLLTPELAMVDRMIYVYMTTAAMISSMFAYSVNRPTFYAFTLPIMIPAMSTLLWPTFIFPWPFSVGLATLYLVVLGIAKNFSQVFEESVSLRFRNEGLYRELANERDQSISANVAKSKFIASASHDLRQPLQAININLDLYSSRLTDDKDQLLFKRLKSSVTALNSMFDALLNMSKLDAYSTQPNNKIFSLPELADSVTEMVQSQASSKGIDLKVMALERKVHGDPLLLKQVLMNLTLNAIQYTKAGTVEVCFFDQAPTLCFSVKDTGVGIPEAEQAHIFKEFYRSDQTRSEHEGLGLGLTIVTRLCRLIGATVNLEKAMKVSDRLGGHIVQGHVDSLATLSAINEGEDWYEMVFEVPANYLKYLQAQGSVTLNGVSLTVAKLNDETKQLSVWLIPETLKRTNLSALKVGDLVNLEVDVLAKYVERIMKAGRDE